MAKGSHMVRGEYPRACAGCGKQTALNECWQEEIAGVKRSWHYACRLGLSRRVPREERGSGVVAQD